MQICIIYALWVRVSRLLWVRVQSSDLASVYDCVINNAMSRSVSLRGSTLCGDPRISADMLSCRMRSMDYGQIIRQYYTEKLGQIMSLASFKV